MDISKIPDNLSNTTSRQLSPAELFRQIARLDSIEAKVALIEKGQALLTTRLGQIISSNALDLKQGDRLSLRAGDNAQNPVLKITKLPTPPTNLKSVTNQVLNQVLLTGKAVSALVIGQQAGKTIIQLGRQQISIQPAVGSKPGQLITLLKSANNQNIELRSVDHQQVLKSALNQLLPQQARPQQSAALTQLVKLIQATVAAKTTGDNPSISTTKSSTQPTNMSNLTPPKATPANSQPATTSQSANLFNQLQSLLSALPELSKLDKNTIKQWVRYMVTAGQSRESGAQSTQNPYQLLQQLAKSETFVTQELRQALAQSAQKTTIEVEAKTKFDEPFQTIGKEIAKLVEQSVSQQLLQQTNLRLQQELQLPFHLNLAIPFTDQQKSHELRLKIHQRNPEADPENQTWDIHLDFEFGLLGLISTHILLDGNRLSASFWSQQIETQDKIDGNLDDFKQQLTRAGYDLGQFHSFPGKPPKGPDREAMAMPETLLDIRV